jgi:23S rRNA pseudouridine955/2504/2580 synthase
MIAVLARAEGLIMVDKPAGISVQPGERAGRDIVDILEGELGFRPFLVHRLDRDTSGVLALAENAEAAKRWSEIFASRSAIKGYAAIVSGEPPAEAGTIDEDIEQRGKVVEALTRWRLIARAAPGPFPLCLLDLSLGTGRTHQIRIHLAGAGLPIVGDDKHGDFKLNKGLAKAYGAKRLMLHARSLEVAAPSGRTLKALAPWPEAFAAFAAAAGIGLPGPLCLG